MCADFILEEENSEDIERAVLLLYHAADKGHRYARQKIRELLKEIKV